MLYEAMKEEIAKTEECGKRTYDGALQNRVNEAYVVGAGDSFAAALVIQGVTYGRFKAVDPYEAQFSYVSLKKPYVIVSVSGRTKENILVAKKIRDRGGKVIAVTANPESELARNSNTVVVIDYQRPKHPLPGTLSFTLSVIALYGLAGVEINSFKEIVNTRPRKLVGLEPIFIGTLGGYGVAYYSALKFYEIFGSKARFERTEQFCHATMFSVRENDQVIVYPSENDRRAMELVERIKDKFNVAIYDRCNGETKPLCQILDFQESLAEFIKELGLEKPYYLITKDILNISSELIY